DGSLRPLPSTVVSWACPSLVVTSGPFRPGFPVELEVTAANYGLGTYTALVEINVLWASFSAGGGVSATQPFAKPVALVPSHGGTGAPDSPITYTIDASAGRHCCLFVSAKFQKDAPSATPDPLNDRHWAQVNLIAPELADDGSFNAQFWAGNPLRER